MRVLFMVFLLLSACGAEPPPSDRQDLAEGQARSANRDVKFPRDLIKDIEKWYVASERQRDPQRAGTDLEVLGTLKRKLMDLEVRLFPKSGNGLERGLRFRLPTGGGTIDLADHVRGNRGGFWVKMGFAKEIDGLNGLRVYYLSEGRRRSVRGEDVGSGCGKLAEMTTWFNGAHGKRDLDVYVADQRYVSVLAGTWLFVALAKSELLLGSITFTDSRFPHLLCPSAAPEL